MDSWDRVALRSGGENPRVIVIVIAALIVIGGLNFALDVELNCAVSCSDEQTCMWSMQRVIVSTEERLQASGYADVEQKYRLQSFCGVPCDERTCPEGMACVWQSGGPDRRICQRFQ